MNSNQLTDGAHLGSSQFHLGKDGFSLQRGGIRMDERQSGLEDEAAIRNVVESWASAVRRRDVDGILQNHSSDIVMFDVPPPFQSKGIEAYKKTWDLFFSWSSDPVLFDVTEISITAGRDVAFVVAAMRCAEPGMDGKQKELDFR
jgi:ketosteroid isomerase-like protein